MDELCCKRSCERPATALVVPSVRATVSKSIWILVLVLCAAPASAEIFKCAGKNGADLYQNFPCHIDSLGSLPSIAPPATTPLPPGDASQAKPKATAVNVASTAKPANAGEPGVGMTHEEVRAIWGEPVETIEEDRREGRTEIWRYGDNRSVKFNRKERVVAVKR